MRKPAYILAAFAFCLSVLLLAIASVTRTALRFHRAEAEARRLAAVEENVRLALWRMDSLAAPIIAGENSLSPEIYRTYYPPAQVFNRELQQVSLGEILVPSPLAAETGGYIRIHFQIGRDGKISSPEVPESHGQAAVVPQADIPRSNGYDEALDELRSIVSWRSVSALAPSVEIPAEERLPAEQQADASEPNAKGGKAQAQTPYAVARQQATRNDEEWRARSRNIDMSNTVALTRQMAGRRARTGRDLTGLLRPAWVNDRLFLVRRVTLGGEELVQGCWLEWDSLRKALLDEVVEIFPKSELVPIQEPGEGDRSRMLASLPVRFVPGPLALQIGDTQSPVVLPLITAWAAAVLAIVAVTALLWGAVSLSERRAAFVSAVSHELRTPLTTFGLYTEMLADGMVGDETRRREYLQTLKSEAARLSHLVENVLLYSRLERNRAAASLETVSVRDLLARVADRLRQRAARDEMTLSVEQAESDRGLLRVDCTAVEQILFNLIDNACKYASHAEDRHIRLKVEAGQACVFMRVCDRGPGIARREEPRLFRPFTKSARDAAESAPGIGLGLALSRRLARAMGGDLVLDAGYSGGACFTLRLPLVV